MPYATRAAFVLEDEEGLRTAHAAPMRVCTYLFTLSLRFW